MSRDASAVMDILRRVPDPEIPVISIVDLGIVRRIVCDADSRPTAVDITPTYTGCPATAAIMVSVRTALDAAGHVDLGINVLLSPPWSSDWITPEGRRKLLDYGIAPPERGRPVACPQCGSASTVEISRFGSTPCKALWQCRTCLEPFDSFKCH
jgi:ring-1,2-phenylacetyl-CoA epoxidase subunit PaaD